MPPVNGIRPDLVSIRKTNYYNVKPYKPFWCPAALLTGTYASLTYDPIPEAQCKIYLGEVWIPFICFSDTGFLRGVLKSSVTLSETSK